MGKTFGRAVEVYRRQFVDTERRTVGIANENVVISTINTGTTPFRVAAVLARLQGQGWRPVRDDVYMTSVIGVEKDGCRINSGMGGSVLEISTPFRDDLRILWKEYNKLWDTVSEAISLMSGMPLGCGINPFFDPGRTNPEWAHQGRLQTLCSVLPSTMPRIAFTASSRVYVSVGEDELVSALNVLNALAGVYVALFANSPIAGREYTQKAAYREWCWDAVASERAGIIPRRFKTLNEYLSHAGGMPLLLAKTNGRYFCPRQTFTDYAGRCAPESFERHLRYHEETLWWDARPRSEFGAVEVRAACAQSHDEVMSVAALSLGIVEMLDEAVRLLDRCAWSEWRSMRLMAICGGMKDANLDLIEQVLSIAQQGLCRRGGNEERFLVPLRERLRQRLSPAEILLENFRKQGTNALFALAT